MPEPLSYASRETPRVTQHASWIGVACVFAAVASGVAYVISASIGFHHRGLAGESEEILFFVIASLAGSVPVARFVLVADRSIPRRILAGIALAATVVADSYAFLTWLSLRS